MTRPALRNYFVGKMSPVLAGALCALVTSGFGSCLIGMKGPHGNGLGEWLPERGWRQQAAAPPCSRGPTCLWLGEDIVLCRHQLCDRVF